MDKVTVNKLKRVVKPALIKHFERKDHGSIFSIGIVNIVIVKPEFVVIDIAERRGRETRPPKNCRPPSLQHRKSFKYFTMNSSLNFIREQDIKTCNPSPQEEDKNCFV